MGNVIIGQSGGPTAVINSSLAGAVWAAKKAGVNKIYGMHYGIEGFLKEDIIDFDDYIDSFDDLSLLKRTPSAFLGSCRYKLPKIEGNESVYENMFRILEKYDIDRFLYIGGNDSMDTINQLSIYAKDHNKPQRFVGIPKTIDNDLPITDHTPGYGSAAKYIATSMKEMIRDNESFGANDPKVCVIEIMGRNAGWLTAAAALAKSEDCSGPDLIYLPEKAFDMDTFIKRVGELGKEKTSIIIAVSEGAHLEDGTMVCELGDYMSFVDAFGHKQLTGCSKVLANQIAKTYGWKSRAIEFSIMQRCATHMASRADIDEAYNVGYTACKAVLEGETAKMATIKVLGREPYIVSYDLVDVNLIANQEKKFPDEWITADGTYVTDDFITYATPLIIGDIAPHYAAGLPVHMTLDKKIR